MRVGISSASLFGRCDSESAIKILNNGNVDVAEVFMESFSEYNKQFGKRIKKVKGNMEIHSVHSLPTQYEPTLFSINEKAKNDSFAFLNGAMAGAKIMGAKYYTFHGIVRYINKPVNNNLDFIGDRLNEIIDTTEKYGVSVAFENVCWCYYNYLGFFTEMKKRVDRLKGTLDIKQASRSQIPYQKLIDEMGSDIVTCHLSDVDENGKMCLPGKGVTDFDLLFNRLNDVGFDGAILIESYEKDYKEIDELFSSYNFLVDKAQKIFKK